jgi:hypothetical protein
MARSSVSQGIEQVLPVAGSEAVRSCGCWDRRRGVILWWVRAWLASLEAQPRTPPLASVAADENLAVRVAAANAVAVHVLAVWMEWNIPRSPSARTITPTIRTIVATRTPSSVSYAEA